MKAITQTTKKSVAYGVADIEANNWIEHLVTGFYCKDRFGNDVLEYFYGGKQDVTDFLEFVVSDENPVDVIFAHYGGKYDFMFFLKAAITDSRFLIENMLPRGSGLLGFDLVEVKKSKKDLVIESLNDSQILKFEGKYVYHKGRVVRFNDSSAMLPCSLESLTNDFGVANKKLKIDYNFKGVTKEVLEYLEYDLKGLYQVIEKYREWPLIKKAGASSTIAGQAMKIFRTTLKKPLLSIPVRADEFVRKAYFGGRTEIFKPLYFPKAKTDPLHCFDVNSLYPTVMQRTDHFPGDFKCFTNKYEPESLGFYDCEVEVPENMYIPPLGIVHEVQGSNKLIFPTGRFKGRFSTREIEYARSIGVKILSTGRGALFHDAGPLFREYVDMLYDIRLKAKKNSVDNVLAKLLMNSCYGRFGLNLNRESVEFDEGQSGVRLLAEIPMDDGSITRLVTRDVQLDKSFTNVGISAWVTAEARLFMHKKLANFESSIFYCDTDSMFTTQWMEDETGLGGLKHEYSCDSACFLLPKTYVIQADNLIFSHKNRSGEVVRTDRKIVMKGFDKNDVTHFTIEDFICALEGDLRRLSTSTHGKMATFKTAIKKGNLLTMLDESTRGIKSHYDKRRIIKNSHGYDTEPLVIRDGVVRNLD